MRVQEIDGGLVRGEDRLGGQCRLHRVVEPGAVQPGRQPLAGPVDEPGRDRHAQQHADQVRGPLGRHVPVRRQQHRRGVDARPVGDAARLRRWRCLRGVDLAAAWAGQQRQQVLGGERRDLHVPDLGPPGARPLRATQAGAAPRAFRRRRHLRPLVRVQVPRQPRPGMPGLPAALAVRPALAFRRLPRLPLRPAAFPGPDRVLRRRRARGRAVLPQPAFQLGGLQLQQAAPLQQTAQLRPQHRILGVLGLDDRPQPGEQLTQLPGISRQARHIGHRPRSCSTSATGSSAPAPHVAPAR